MCERERESCGTEVREGAMRRRTNGDRLAGSGILQAAKKALDKVLRLIFKIWCSLHRSVPFVAVPSYSFETWKKWLYKGLVTYFIYPYAHKLGSGIMQAVRKALDKVLRLIFEI
ncbi:hypothetical protein KP509_36G028500 [Ceratopteris richardii]|uniref:Uncharacterized protein n=1 Tax=Ceratopteris richardii TaxID=49495 RepID=A0A8T2QBS8_CERRI|nr:hypothetical protein KP509_36G028500 [Ceratopteris richardii]